MPSKKTKKTTKRTSRQVHVSDLNTKKDVKGGGAIVGPEELHSFGGIVGPEELVGAVGPETARPIIRRK